MTTTKTEHTDMNRREFLSTTAAVGGAMVLGFWLPPSSAEAAGQAVAAQPWYRDPMVPEINAWITIAPDDTVTIRVGQTEIGTGVFTANPMMSPRSCSVTGARSGRSMLRPTATRKRRLRSGR